eukprot:TRINITY_DN34005_c0_g1_i1.p1 TRINITY_DN34005_c0_g1~~TRINITY_DN34005_c0_g1_i1.p1  ORF type:complete len:279 (+),score=78.32 TRINITY_DN34005_c0_g1_i1:102-938(+)
MAPLQRAAARQRGLLPVLVSRGGRVGARLPAAEARRRAAARALPLRPARCCSGSPGGDSGVRLRHRTEKDKFYDEAQRSWHRQGRTGENPETSLAGEEINKLGYACATLGLFSLGCCFLAVPLYRLYCSSGTQVSGSAALQAQKHQSEVFESGQAKRGIAHVVKVLFGADLGSKDVPLMFVPLQKSIHALLGEPALAFFNVYNRSDKTLIGLSTYNVAPAEASPYFNKIQCFCFEEQRIKPHELIEMPVFFFVDKEFAEDPSTALIGSILLNYTFFVV